MIQLGGSKGSLQGPYCTRVLGTSPLFPAGPPNPVPTHRLHLPLLALGGPQLPFLGGPLINDMTSKLLAFS